MCLSNNRKPIKNHIDEQGSVIAIVLLVLVMLTLLGTMSLNRSRTEISTAGNEWGYKQNIYSAESAAIENAFAIETADALDLKNEGSRKWLNRDSDLPNQAYIFDPDNWTDVNSTASIETGSRYLTVTEGIVAGGSMDMSVSKVYEYSIFSRCQRNSGLSMVRVGYRRALK